MLEEETKKQLLETGFIRLVDILEYIPVGKTTWWQRVKDGLYPKPVKLGPRTTAWKVEDIRNLIEEIGNSKNV